MWSYVVKTFYWLCLVIVWEWRALIKQIQGVTDRDLGDKARCIYFIVRRRTGILQLLPAVHQTRHVEKHSALILL